MTRTVENKNVLVTGGAGFIGSHLVDEIISRRAKNVVVMDNMFLGTEKNISTALAKGCKLYKDDAEFLSSIEYILKEQKIDIVFNLATKPLNYSFINPANCFSCNTNIAINLLELQRQGLFETLCQYSTSEVYGTAVYEPMDENHPINPLTTYAAGKAGADKAVESYIHCFDLDAFIIRPFNNFGPRQNSTPPLSAVIPATIRRISEGEKPLIYGDGTQTRDFIYVLDTVRATLDLFENIKTGESVNVSTTQEVQIKDLVYSILEIMNLPNEVDFVENRKADVTTHASTNKKLLSLLDFQFTDFPKALETTVKWYCDEFAI